jgi:hypothetical protein
VAAVVRHEALETGLELVVISSRGEGWTADAVEEADQRWLREHAADDEHEDEEESDAAADASSSSGASPTLYLTAQAPWSRRPMSRSLFSETIAFLARGTIMAPCGETELAFAIGAAAVRRLLSCYAVVGASLDGEYPGGRILVSHGAQPLALGGHYIPETASLEALVRTVRHSAPTAPMSQTSLF